MLYKITRLKSKVDAKKEEVMELEQTCEELQEQLQMEKDLGASAQSLAQDAQNQLLLARAKVDSLADRLEKQDSEWKT